MKRKVNDKPVALSRRGFLRGSLAAGGALSIAVTFGCGSNARAVRIRTADDTGALAADLYVTVKPDGRIALTVNKHEMGQGVTTGYATLVAEELGVSLDHVDCSYASSNPAMRNVSSGTLQATGGSSSTKEAFIALRQAAAAAREMLVAAAARQWAVPATACSVADGQVHHAGSKRSTPYGALTKLAARESVPSSPRIKPAKEFTLIGKVSRRIEIRGKLDGSATFGIDVQVPGMVSAVMIHGPVFGARPDRISDARARKRPGVIDVFAIPSGVAVVADKYWQAVAAAEDVEVTWHKGDTAGLDSEALQQAMRTSGEGGATTIDRGDADAAIERAGTGKQSGVYEAPYVAHAPLEPQNATASVTGDRVVVWAPTQSPTIVQGFVSDAIGCGFEDVTVHTTLSGGGFGRRSTADVCAEAALISKHVKRPVKLIWSRESDMTQAFYRPVYAIHMDGAVHDGKAAVRARCLSQSITLSAGQTFASAMPALPPSIRTRVVDAMLATFSTNSMTDLFATEGMQDSPYELPHYRLAAAPVRTKLPVTIWRAVGNSVTGFAMEGFLDELAHQARQDPFAFRRAMLPAQSRQARVLDELAKRSGWGTAPRAGIGRGMARHFAFDTEVGQVADVEIVDGRIKVRRVVCVVDCGIAINPDIVRAQMEGAIIFGLSAALDQQITLVDGVVQQRNFDRFPLLRMFECPEIVVEILDSDREPTGVGEAGLPPIAPAVANAVFALTGVRLRRMPLQRAWNERAAR